MKRVRRADRPSTRQALSIVERALRRAGLDGWEIYFSESRTLSAEAQDGKLESLSRAVSAGVGVRVLVGGAPGFSHTTDLCEQVLIRCAERAAAAARVATPDPAVGFAAPADTSARALDLFDASLNRVSERRKIDLALELEARTSEADRNIARVRNAAYEEEIRTVEIRNSLGLHRRARESAVGLSVMAVAERGEESEAGDEFQDARRFAQLDVARVARSAARRAARQLGGKTIRSYTGPVVIENLAAGELLDVLASSFCADEVQKGKSGLAGKTEKRVFAPCIDILDDGLLRGELGSFPFDDEGVPHRRTVLVKEGELQGFLYDTTSARRRGGRSTGSAVRAGGFAGAPGVGISNLYIPKGRRSAVALRKELGKGLLLTDFMGVHTANEITGEFSFGCAGLVIENGDIVAPFKGMAVAGNLFELFRRVEVLGSDLRFSGGVGAPSLLVGKLSIAGR